MSKRPELEHQPYDRLARVAGFSGGFQLGQIVSPQRVLTHGKLIEVVPGEQSAVMTVVEGQFQCVLAGGLDLGQTDIELAELQDRFAVALDLGGGGVHAKEFGGQLIHLVRTVGKAQGLGGFVQVDGGRQFGHLGNRSEMILKEPALNCGSGLARECGGSVTVA